MCLLLPSDEWHGLGSCDRAHVGWHAVPRGDWRGRKTQSAMGGLRAVWIHTAHSSCVLTLFLLQTGKRKRQTLWSWSNIVSCVILAFKKNKNSLKIPDFFPPKIISKTLAIKKYIRWCQILYSNIFILSKSSYNIVTELCVHSDKLSVVQRPSPQSWVCSIILLHLQCACW